jgi:16S rRNA G1207 methylase RsmC
MASDYLPLLKAVRPRLQGPCLVALGSPRAAADIVHSMQMPETTCFQLDQFQADRLQTELAAQNLTARVIVTPDLWDLHSHGSVIIPSPPHGNRELKLDLVEQAYHALRPGGILAVLSPVEKDQLYPAVMKKVFDKVALQTDRNGTVLWSHRNGDHKRRRHEMTFSAKVGEGDYREFLTRPGLFSYGRLDEGTRALLDVLEVRPGERILEIGCGCGVAGIISALRSGDAAQLTLIDSNARAIAVAKLNVAAHGLQARCEISADGEGLPTQEYDLVLANPPYFAQHTITRKFAEQASRLMKRNGRLYLVTRQLDPVLEIIEELFGETLVLERRNYAVIVATK